MGTACFLITGKIMTINARFIGFEGAARTSGPILQVVHRGLIRLWRESVGEFITATADAMAVDTGMSVASLQPLAAKVRLATVIREIARGKGPKRRSPGDVPQAPFQDNFGPFRSRALGERLGRNAFELEFGTPRTPLLKFQFRIVILQHFLNDNGLGNVANPPVWQSLEKGEAAFLDHFNREFAARNFGARISEMLLTGRLIEL